MTSGAQPPNSGAPTPVQGVTGGPPVLGGQVGNDPATGNVVVAPNPGNVLQVRKGSTPQSFQVYEYFHTNTDFARVALNSQLGGPFQLAVEAAPSSVNRDLQILAAGTGVVTIPALSITRQTVIGTNTALTSGIYTPITGSVASLSAGTYLFVADVGVTSGASAVQFIYVFAPATTGNTGAPNVLGTVGSFVVPTATASMVAPFTGIIVIPATANYQLMVSANTTGTSASCRWSAIKIAP